VAFNNHGLEPAVNFSAENDRVTQSPVFFLRGALSSTVAGAPQAQRRILRLRRPGHMIARPLNAGIRQLLLPKLKE
jgi:hypothetical protein